MTIETFIILSIIGTSILVYLNLSIAYLSYKILSETVIIRKDTERIRDETIRIKEISEEVRDKL